LAGTGGQRMTGFAGQLHGAFVKTHLRILQILGFGL
jgi:hypothetical protein